MLLKTYSGGLGFSLTGIVLAYHARNPGFNPHQLLGGSWEMEGVEVQHYFSFMVSSSLAWGTSYCPFLQLETITESHIWKCPLSSDLKYFNMKGSIEAKTHFFKKQIRVVKISEDWGRGKAPSPCILLKFVEQSTINDEARSWRGH